VIQGGVGEGVARVGAAQLGHHGAHGARWEHLHSWHSEAASKEFRGEPSRRGNNYDWLGIPFPPSWHGEKRHLQRRLLMMILNRRWGG